jgi:predicted  nucleic acid-binding Zn-ribbon protein
MDNHVNSVKFQALEKEVDELKDEVRTLAVKVAGLETRTSVVENDIRNIQESLKKIDSNTTWILRLILGSIILAILGLVITQKAGALG